ncbi:hypothetical protein [Caulobacter sp. LARHSG274]
MRPTSFAAAAVLALAAVHPALAGNSGLLGAIKREATKAAGSNSGLPAGDVQNALSVFRAVRTAAAAVRPPSPKAEETPGPAAATTFDAPDAIADEPTAAGFAEPAPVNYSSREIHRPQDLRFSETMSARKKALEQFGKSPCDACEGGYQYDTSVRHLVAGWTRQDGAFEQKVGAMHVGESFNWRGATTSGLFRVESEAPIGPFPCKQVRYVLTRGKQSADRLGLFCFGKREYSTLDEWIEVF